MKPFVSLNSSCLRTKFGVLAGFNVIRSTEPTYADSVSHFCRENLNMDMAIGGSSNSKSALPVANSLLPLTESNLAIHQACMPKETAPIRVKVQEWMNHLSRIDGHDYSVDWTPLDETHGLTKEKIAVIKKVEQSAK